MGHRRMVSAPVQTEPEMSVPDGSIQRGSARRRSFLRSWRSWRSCVPGVPGVPGVRIRFEPVTDGENGAVQRRPRSGGAICAIGEVGTRDSCACDAGRPPRPAEARPEPKGHVPPDSSRLRSPARTKRSWKFRVPWRIWWTIVPRIFHGARKFHAKPGYRKTPPRRPGDGGCFRSQRTALGAYRRTA